MAHNSRITISAITTIATGPNAKVLVVVVAGAGVVTSVAVVVVRLPVMMSVPVVVGAGELADADGVGCWLVVAFALGVLGVCAETPGSVVAGGLLD
jgi:hypothetical protein